ncbi:MAG: DUF5317 domain-containing protein [Actinomycetota bacterium]|nr:DUF5317 domain-containing protein [Actinomycetota bacterium]
MELVAIAVVGGAVAGLLAGGSLDSLATTRFRWTPLLLASLVGQLVLQFWSPSWLTPAVSLAALLALNALVAAFLARNRRLPGTLLAAVGLLLNVAVIAANGAMPVSEEAARIAGIESSPSGEGFKHEPLDDDTRLPLLADALPAPFFRSVYSLGDIYLALGILYLVFARTRAKSRGRHSAAEEPD